MWIRLLISSFPFVVSLLLFSAAGVHLLSAKEPETLPNRPKKESSFSILPVVKFGIDNLADLRFEPLRGKRIALVCNSASRTRLFHETLQTILSAEGIELSALLLPEHGYFCSLTTGSCTITIPEGVPVYYLTGEQQRPSASMLAGSDVVVIDLQDIGLSTSPAITTLYHVLDACAEYKLPVFILDRPNPLGGTIVDGIIPDAPLSPATLPIPYLHGMTIGELALMINEEGWLSLDKTGSPRKCTLNIIKMRRWRRGMSWEAIMPVWIPTSPTITTVQALRGMALLGPLGEIGAVSIGLGTEQPYCLLGAPDWSDDIITAVLEFFRAHSVNADTALFLPHDGPFAGKKCRGVVLRFNPSLPLPFYSLSRQLMTILAQIYPPFNTRLRGRANVQCSEMTSNLTSTTMSKNMAAYQERTRRDRHIFQQQRLRYLLYP